MFGISANISSWALMEQVSMADNFHRTSVFYPDCNDEFSSSASTYFPGLVLVSIVFI